MNQILKISIARGGCRFATPLYLGASYVLSFDGARSDEAKTVLFTKPNSRTPTKTEGIEGLAITVTEGSDLVLKLNRQSLVDWFLSCGECDVDGYVDAHCYVFNSDGDVIADDGVHIEYRPVDFVVDATGFTQYSALAERVATLEAFRVEDRAKIDANESAIAELQNEDQSIRDDLAEAINEKAGQTLESAKNYADLLRQMVAKMMYIRDVDESESAGYDRYRRVEAKKNSLNQVIISLSDELFNLEGGDSSTNRYLYTDTNNVEDYDEDDEPTADHNPITGNKTFTGIVLVNTPLAADNSRKPATTAWVRTFDATQWDAHKSALLAAANTWSAKQTHTDDIEITGTGKKLVGNVQGNVTGNVTGSVTGNVTGNVTGDIEGGVTVGFGKSLSVAGSSSFSGTETHTGNVTIEKMVEPELASMDALSLGDTQGVNAKFVWKILGLLTKYVGGGWRLDTSSSPSFTSVDWRQHDRQFGYLNWIVETLPNACFKSSNTIYNAELPNVETVGQEAFYGQTSLNLIVLPKCKTIGAWAFYNGNSLYKNPANFDGTNMPLVEDIGANAFNKVDYVTVVNFPRGKHIETDAFKSGFGTLTSISIGSAVDVSELGDGSDLVSAIESISSGMLTTDSDVFESLVTAYPNLKSEFTFFDGYVYDKNSLTTVNMPTMQIFGDYAVHSAQTLSSLNIPECVFIGRHAFSDIRYNTDVGEGNGIVLNIPKCLAIASHGIGGSAWNVGISGIEKVRADNLLYLGNCGARMQTRLTQFYAPELRKIGKTALFYTPRLVGSSYIDGEGNVVGTPDCLSFPKCTDVMEDGLRGYHTNSECTKISLPSCLRIGNNALAEHSNLKHLYLYALNGNSMVQRSTGTADDQYIKNWGLPTTAWSYDSTTRTHTGVSIHCKNDANQNIIVGYVNGSWTVVGLEEDYPEDDE